MKKEETLKEMEQYIKLGVWCEECSTPNHPVMMGEGTCPSFKCPICKKEVMVLLNPIFNFGSHYSANCDKCIELEKKGITFGKENKIQKKGRDD